MIGAEKALVILLKPAEARGSFPDWPDQVFLAICLLSCGECRLIVFREEEFGSFLPRLVWHLSIESAELCVVPRVAGHPSRRLLYTDEQRLRQIVAATPSIVDEAADYSANFSFALEEGLDPAGLLGLEKVVVETIVKPAARISFAPRVELPRKSNESLGLPKFITKQIETRTAPGPGFRSAVEIGEQEGTGSAYYIQVADAGWVSIERCDGSGLGVRVSDPRQVFVSDDEKTLAFSLVPNWSWMGKLPGRLHISILKLPWRIQKLLEENAGAVTLSVDDHFVLVHLNRQSASVVDGPMPDEMALKLPPAHVATRAKPRLLGRFLGPRSRSEMRLISSITILILVGFTVLRFAPASADASNHSAAVQIQE